MITAFIPAPQTLLTVKDGLYWLIPARTAACPAEFLPSPACSTLPIITSSTFSGLICALARTSFITISPNSSAGTVLNAPPNPPMAVRTALAITTSRIETPSSPLFLAQVLNQHSDILVLILMDIFYEIFQGSYQAEAILFKDLYRIGLGSNGPGAELIQAGRAGEA